ncbi:MAG: amidohydrolase family protein [Gemmatimonadetes bacterium]|nr:amidohydrolase family protein [Gemmatimonadota bacterium]NIO32988.1 amidohydrolase family protein [Gemmatimonadota bacterium]
MNRSNSDRRCSWIGIAAAGLAFWVVACAGDPRVEPADLLLLNGRVYTFSWGDPALDGTPAPDAPLDAEGWHPDAEAVAVRDGRIVFVGDNEGAGAYRGTDTEVLDLNGSTVLPGLVDSHVHIAGLGANLERVDMMGVSSAELAIEQVAAAAVDVPLGEWIIGWGWDEGAWANDYPDNRLLSERVPNHPVMLRGLHGFAVWGNKLAFELAGITAETRAPTGGEILKDAEGEPTGILVNNATRLLEAALPELTQEQLESRVLAGLEAMAVSGYVAVHEAGAGAELMAAFENLEAMELLPIRVYAMLAGRDEPLLREWLERGPDRDTESMLITRSVKAFYDGALGSRGAEMLEDYSDTPGHRGVGGDQYGFDEELFAEMMGAGFQICIHAIGDGGNRASLDFIESVYEVHPEARDFRHRIEHAQVVHPDDFARFASLSLIASMEPPHAVEDKTWAEDRVGPQRIRGAYAWRTMRRDRRSADLQLRSAGLRSRHLLWPAFCHHAPRSGSAAAGRLVSRGDGDRGGGAACLYGMGGGQRLPGRRDRCSGAGQVGGHHGD